MPISYIAVMATSDYIMTGTGEIELKNGSRNIYIHVYLEKLPYMVSLIMKQIPRLDSHRKTGSGDI